MELEQVQHFNWVDWGIIVLILLAIVSGIRRGFLLGALDLGSIAVSLAVAILVYRPVARFVGEIVDIPLALALLGSFLVLFILAQSIYSVITNLILHVTEPVWLALGPLSFLNHGLGVATGLLKGLLYATLLILPFAMFPLIPQVSAGIERSEIGSALVDVVVDRAPEIESLLGRDLEGGLAFLPPPQTPEGRTINFGPLGQLAPDPVTEQRMLELVNQERAAEGLPPLEFDEELQEVARAHSREMFELGYFSHHSPETGSPFDRIRQAGIRFLVAGENLAYAPNVQIAHEGLMNSPGHRANILRPAFGRVGIGAIRSELRGTMFTQKFRD